MEENSTSWAHLAACEGYGRASLEDEYPSINYSDSFKEPYSDFRHGAHCMIYAKDDGLLFKLYRKRAAVMMQLRFDGYLGFPGGLIDPEDKDIVSGLNRELEEEIGLDLNLLCYSQEDHISTYACSSKKLILHFYSKEVPLKLFGEIEKKSLEAPDLGLEALGSVRVPCYVLPDKERGLPIFLANKFAGNAQIELEEGLVKAGIFTSAEFSQMKFLSEEYKKKFSS